MAKQAGVSEAVKGTVLSAFFWGYAVSQARTCRRVCARSARAGRLFELWLLDAALLCTLTSLRSSTVTFMSVWKSWQVACRTYALASGSSSCHLVVAFLNKYDAWPAAAVDTT